MFTTFAALLSRHDVLIAPAVLLAPFPVEWEYPREVDGVPMDGYLDWMRACTRITVSGHPVAAVPAGFTEAGLPVGIQMVGAHRGERRLLEIAAGWEAVSGLTRRRPPLAGD